MIKPDWRCAVPIPFDRQILLTELEMFLVACEQMLKEHPPHSTELLRAFTLRIDPELKDALITTREAANYLEFSVDVGRRPKETREDEKYYVLTFVNQRAPLHS